MPTVSPTLLPSHHPAVVSRSLPDGAVLFSTTDEVYFGLNETGAFIWEHLAPTCATLDALCDAVIARFPDADSETVREDVAELLAALIEHGLTVPG